MKINHLTLIIYTYIHTVSLFAHFHCIIKKIANIYSSLFKPQPRCGERLNSLDRYICIK